MTPSQERMDHIGALSQMYASDEVPAVWAARAVSVIASIIGRPESLDKDDIVELLEVLYVMAPDPILIASAEVSMYINNLNLGETK